MPFRIFRVRTVAGANVAGLLLGAVVFANFFILTLYVQQVLGWSALKTGRHVRRDGRLGGPLGRRRAGARDADRRRRSVMAVGFVAMIAGMLWYTQIPVDASYWTDLLPGYLLVGFALPFTFIPVSIAALAGVEHHEAGLASGLINTAQQVGGAIGVAVTSSVLDQPLQRPASRSSPFDQVAFTRGYAAGRSGSRVGISVVGLIATLVLIRRDELATATGRRGDRRRSGAVGFRRRMARDVPDRHRPRRQHADRAARSRLARRPGHDPGEARVPEPGRIEQGPDRARDDRGGRARREAASPAARSSSRPRATPASGSRSRRRRRATGASS